MSELKELEHRLKLQLTEPLGLSQAQFNLSTRWSSNNSGHRQDIRSAAALILKSLGADAEDLARIARLDEIPRVRGHALSISHCPDIGGFVFVANLAGAVGFDVEITGRIKKAAAARVLVHQIEGDLRETLKGEKSAGLAPSIWTAKEASIKALGNAHSDNSLTYAQVELTSLQQSTEHGYEFRSRYQNSLARGYVWHESHRTFALAVHLFS